MQRRNVLEPLDDYRKPLNKEPNGLTTTYIPPSTPAPTPTP